MIINPSPLLALNKVHANSWTYIKNVILGTPPHRRYYRVICLCDKPPTPAIPFKPEDLSPTEIFAKQADMIGERFGNGNEYVEIWAGKCDCGRGYWTCNKFDWVTWLDDFQTVKMLLSAVPINHAAYDGVSQPRIIIHKDTQLIFYRGKLEHVK